MWTWLRWYDCNINQGPRFKNQYSIRKKKKISNCQLKTKQGVSANRGAFIYRTCHKTCYSLTNEQSITSQYYSYISYPSDVNLQGSVSVKYICKYLKWRQCFYFWKGVHRLLVLRGTFRKPMTSEKK